MGGRLKGGNLLVGGEIILIIVSYVVCLYL